MTIGMDKCKSAVQARSLSRDYSCFSREGCADGRVELSIFIPFFSLSLHSLLAHHRLDTLNLTVSLTDAARKLPTSTPYPNTMCLTDTEAIALTDTTFLKGSL